MQATNISGINWIDANSNRRYPLDDRSHGLDDSGEELPSSLLADLNVWFPDTLGQGLYVSAATVSNALVTVAFAAYPTRPGQSSTAATFNPVGTVTVLKPVTPGKNYPIVPAVSGIGGWVAFGSGVNSLQTNSWRYSTPSASGILPRLARAYPPPGVTLISKYGATAALSGMVNLASSTPDLLVVERGTVTYSEAEHDVIIVRLNTEAGGRSILGQFPGNGGSPLSGTCTRTPITSINGVQPDCDGVLTLIIDETVPVGSLPLLRLSFANQNQDGTTPPVNAYHTLSLELDKGMSDVCPPQPNTLSTDVATPCYDPCTPWDTQGPFSGLAGSWASPPSNEPGMEGGQSFIATSAAMTVNLNTSTSVTPEGYAAGVLIMIPASDSIVQSPSDSAFAAGDTITFTLPSSAIIFRDTVGTLVSSASGSNPDSARKVFNVPGGSALIPFGGSIDSSQAHVDTLFSASVFNLASFGQEIDADFLAAKGYGSGTLSYKYVLIASGMGSTASVSLATGTPAVDDGCDSSTSGS